MASSSNRKSGSSGRSNPRKRVVIGAEETVRVRYNKNQPQVEAERRSTPRQSARAASKRPGGPAPSRQGKRLSAAKRDERERRQQTLRFKRVGLVVAALAAVALLAWGVSAVVTSPMFRVDSIVVSGASRLTDEHVLALARVPSDVSLLQLPASQIVKRIRTEPWVSSVEIERDYPSTVRIAITEREPAVVVDAGGTDLWLMSSDGVWLGRSTALDADKIVVRDVEGLTPVPGRKASSETLSNAVLVARGISPELGAMTRAISAPSVEKTAILTTEDIEIFIGDAESIREKDRIAREILSREKGKVVYINVRVVDRPTWRGLE